MRRLPASRSSTLPPMLASALLPGMGMANASWMRRPCQCMALMKALATTSEHLELLTRSCAPARRGGPRPPAGPGAAHPPRGVLVHQQGPGSAHRPRRRASTTSRPRSTWSCSPRICSSAAWRISTNQQSLGLLTGRAGRTSTDHQQGLVHLALLTNPRGGPRPGRAMRTAAEALRLGAARWCSPNLCCTPELLMLKRSHDCRDFPSEHPELWIYFTW